MLIAVVVLPVAFLSRPGRGRELACSWALRLRFPSEDLAGLTEGARAAFSAARAEAFWRHGQLIGLTSGYRDLSVQQRLFDEEVRRSGSPASARLLVLPPSESRHVRGVALDIRPREGARWLEAHGARYHLYRTYDNEWWHFEHRPDDNRPPTRLPHPGAPVGQRHRSAGTRVGLTSESSRQQPGRSPPGCALRPSTAVGSRSPTAAAVDVGAVSVLYGSGGGLGTAGGRLFTQVGSAAERGDGFGARVAAGDFNSDTYADLAVGAPYEDAGTIPIAGAVSVLYGSAGGVGTAGGQLFTQIGAVEGFDQFGDALATGDFNNDGYTDLAAGAPVEDVSTVPDAGAVSVLFGSPAGITATGARTFTQVGSAPEAGDYFGWALATGDYDNDGFADLAVGAEGEDVFSATDAGAVSVLYGSSAGVTTATGQIFTQDTPVSGAALSQATSSA